MKKLKRGTTVLITRPEDEFEGKLGTVVTPHQNMAGVCYVVIPGNVTLAYHQSYLTEIDIKENPELLI